MVFLFIAVMKGIGVEISCGFPLHQGYEGLYGDNRVCYGPSSGL